ncbi:MAG: aminoacyl-tRNA hydrolase [Mycoplasmataceae bacterium]|jgi:PTH1 family peptidyl-tRNA hydrolase|nr:aminoacyl-tRNA hydrolase [Mycoplasmataceae bacterium]
MKIIIGLGNFPEEYQKTRHNIGFMTIDKLLNKLDINDLDNNNFEGRFTFYNTSSNNEKIIIAKPYTYMNLSGEFVKKIIDFYKININDILVIYDDLDTSVGKIKIKTSGSSGGHNGIKSIIISLGTEEFKRVKIGISRPTTAKKDISSYVLRKIPKSEYDNCESAMNNAIEAIIDFINEVPFDKIMNKYN